ncbi:MAG: NADH-ubiquinone oxidoreductase subunit NDUFA12 family protein [Deltaproteobacteria bacterium]
MGLGQNILRIFTWWNGQTLGTQLFAWRKGTLVGKDAAGNRYYTLAGGKRRWVIFAKEIEATNVSVAWHGWLHGTTDVLPVAGDADQMIGNPTGTPDARVPPHSLRGVDATTPVRDYEEWVPS